MMPTPDAAGRFEEAASAEGGQPITAGRPDSGRKVDEIIVSLVLKWCKQGSPFAEEVTADLRRLADAARRETVERAAAVCERERVRLMEVASQASSPSITEEVRLAQAQTAADLWHNIRKLLPADGEGER